MFGVSALYWYCNRYMGEKFLCNGMTSITTLLFFLFLRSILISQLHLAVCLIVNLVCKSVVEVSKCVSQRDTKNFQIVVTRQCDTEPNVNTEKVQ